MTAADESTATTTPVAPGPFGENRGIKFTLKTAGNTYQCTVKDRSAQYVSYSISPTEASLTSNSERLKRSNTDDSVQSNASTNTQNSA